jgi:hypothetical protein
VRFYKAAANTGTHVGSLWDTSGTRLATGTFANETQTGWQELAFAEPVPIAANTTYIASYHAPNGGYSGDQGWFALEPTVSSPLRALQDRNDEPNGVYRVSPSPTFPTATFRSANYWVDVIFSETQPPDTRPPAVVATTPLADSSSIAVGSVITIAFDEPVDAASVSMSVLDAGSPVAGSVSYDAASDTVTFTPAAPLAYAATHTVTVSAADVSGNIMPAPLSLLFVTAMADGSIGALWDDSVVPGTVDAGDPSSIELGVKFSADEDLDITGVRFYKAALNTGTHVGSLWDASGSLLAQVTFAGESTSGWQQATFSTPVRINAGSTYVVSYHTPDGHYSASGGYFSAAYTNGPLTAPASGPSGGNGVYAYSGSVTFPSSSYNAGNSWVTPIYEVP